MRVLTRLLQVFSLFTLTSAAACPYAHAAETGLLTHAEQGKYQAAKRDGIASDTFSELHKKDGPGLTLSLNLTLGGGLRM